MDSKSLGALLGLAVGDALGAPLEFSRGNVSREKIESASSMPGGGPHGVSSGQVTDDTELALALAGVLSGKSPSMGFPRDAVIEAYKAWFDSDPFDVGSTCAEAFCPRRGRFFVPSPESQSNGSIMRIAPLAVWARHESDDVIAEMAMEDSRLTHSNRNVIASTAAYAVALSSLARGETPESALGRAGSWLLSNKASGSSTVLGWLASADVTTKDCEISGSSSGWARHAFVLAFRHLVSGKTFGESLLEVLKLGGDTDTNLAVVGAMLGARDGIDSIPKKWVGSVLRSRTSLGRPRPLKYHPSLFLSMVL